MTDQTLATTIAAALGALPRIADALERIAFAMDADREVVMQDTLIRVEAIGSRPYTAEADMHVTSGTAETATPAPEKRGRGRPRKTAAAPAAESTAAESTAPAAAPAAAPTAPADPTPLTVEAVRKRIIGIVQMSPAMRDECLALLSANGLSTLDAANAQQLASINAKLPTLEEAARAARQAAENAKLQPVRDATGGAGA